MRFNDGSPIFAQIATLLADEIAAGQRGEGERLPSARELAVSLQVNPNTATRALQALADRGLARCERGAGYFVAEGSRGAVTDERRRRFFGQEIPRLFGMMEELGIGMAELEAAWNQRTAAKPAGEETT